MSEETKRVASDLMTALEEWKNAGAHVSSVVAALEDFLQAREAPVLASEWFKPAFRFYRGDEVISLPIGMQPLEHDDVGDFEARTYAGELTRIRTTLARMAGQCNEAHRFGSATHLQTLVGVVDAALGAIYQDGLEDYHWPPGGKTSS